MSSQNELEKHDKTVKNLLMEQILHLKMLNNLLMMQPALKETHVSAILNNINLMIRLIKELENYV